MVYSGLLPIFTLANRGISHVNLFLYIHFARKRIAYFHNVEAIV